MYEDIRQIMYVLSPMALWKTHIERMQTRPVPFTQLLYIIIYTARQMFSSELTEQCLRRCTW